VRRATGWAAVGAGVLLLSCSPSTPPAAGNRAPVPVKEEAAPLAQARMPGTALTLQITGVTRPAPEVLEVAFAIVHGAPPAGAASAADAGGAPGLAPGSEEWFAAAYLLDEERQKRFFAMRDAEGRPRCSPAHPVSGGGRETMSARFPAPASEGGRLTIVVPGMSPFRAVPFPGTAARGLSY